MENSGSKSRETMEHRPENGISELSFTRCAEGKVKGVHANLSAPDTPTEQGRWSRSNAVMRADSRTFPTSRPRATIQNLAYLLLARSEPNDYRKRCRSLRDSWPDWVVWTRRVRWTIAIDPRDRSSRIASPCYQISQRNGDILVFLCALLPRYRESPLISSRV